MARGHFTQQERSEVYSRVLFDSAKKEGGESGSINARNELLGIKDAILSDMDLRSALESEEVSVDDKLKLAETLCSGCMTSVRAILFNMIKNSEIDLIKMVLRKVEDLISEELGLCVVDVVSAVELNDSIRTLIKDKAKKELGLNATLNEVVDKSILGGVILRVNGKCIDASMNTQLNRARAVLKAS